MDYDISMTLSTLGGAVAAWRLFTQLRTIRSLSINPSFGVLTQAASKAMLPTLRTPCDVIFFDVDQMKLFNTLFGWDRTSELVAGALRHAQAAYGRRRMVIWQEFSGDEFGCHVRRGDGMHVARLIQAAFTLQPLAGEERSALHHASGGTLTAMSATIALVPDARCVTAAVEHGKRIVMEQKNGGQRGGISTPRMEVQR